MSFVSNTQPLLTVPQVAELLQTKSATVYGWVTSGLIPGVVRIGSGRSVRIQAKTIQDWIDKGCPALPKPKLPR